MTDVDITGFKKFTGTRRGYKPQVSVRKMGQIAFNMGAVNKYDLAFYKYGILYIAEKKDRVAVRFTNNEKETGVIEIQKRAGNFAMSCRTFLGINDIDVSKTRNFDFIWQDKTKVAIFKPKFVPKEEITSSQIRSVQGVS